MVKNHKKSSIFMLVMLVNLPLITQAKPVVQINFPSISQAKTLICPFTDKFTVASPATTKILNAKTEGNLRYIQQSDTYFTLSCGDDHIGSSGDLFINIGYDNENHCKLKIHDGPYEMNPSVTEVSCIGTKKYTYIGMDHPYGTYDYTLKFVG